MKDKSRITFLLSSFLLIKAVLLITGSNSAVSMPPFQDNPEFNFLQAVSEGNLSETERYLDDEVDPDAADFFGVTGLMLAAINGHTEIMDLLIQYNADVNRTDNDGMTALLYALLYSNDEIVYRLFPLIDEIDHQNEEGFTALMFISQTDNISFAQYAVYRGANVNHTNRLGISPIMYASAFGNFFVVDFLHFHGANMDHQSDDGSAAIHMAAYYGHEEVMGLLLELGTDINMLDSRGNTPLIYAVMARNPVAVWYLMESGANPEIVNNFDFTALSIAISRENTGIVELLTSYDFIEPDPSEKRNTVLARAYYSGNSEIVNLLKGFSGTNPKGLYFSELSGAAKTEFNSNEMMYGIAARIFEARYKILTTASFSMRINERPVQVYQNPELIFQFQESRMIWSLGLQRELFSLPVRRAEFNLYLGFKTLYSRGSYSGTSIGPPSGFNIAPLIDLNYRYKDFSVSGSYYFYRTGQTDIPPNRFQVGIQYHFQLFKTRGMQFRPIIR